MMILLVAFAVLALLLATVGIYGMIFYSTAHVRGRLSEALQCIVVHSPAVGVGRSQRSR